MKADMKLYHPKWSLITRLIRTRAGNRCEHCQVENGLSGYRDRETGRFYTESECMELLDSDGPEFESLSLDLSRKPLKIVCTTAHLDQDRRNNRFGNLAFLCQKCHFAHDRKANVRRRRYGRHFTENNLKIEFRAV